ncbi:hypothetical protein H9L10_01455 [Phycicoccus endophyticus]|uniref:SurA N-terminal domain-containing protein n=1 Tax=Phycicoccus endophyticus TaxID=1690220 RepID=A0A7G9R2G6_9MICO|nr:hypothetical protein [Phycicoccus endophyticus]NHI20825.1 hypothetical protein [Phycicoccus endophyticus]QNN49791.1 hypothetical protein H9L10_01455 [Phycicoccus endophyticus]GGL35179.1 hypothetical protein GCM10012283_16990 [Phycicoccus endophyticus]
MTPSVRRVSAALALGVALVTTGCGTTQANRAATVDGQVITETEVHTAQSQINATFPSANLSTSDVLSRLIQAPVILDLAEQQGSPVSETVAEHTYEQQPDYDGEPAEEPTLEVLRAELALQAIQDAGVQVPISLFEKLDVEVNPRYGDFDPSTASVAETQPEWVESYSTSK